MKLWKLSWEAPEALLEEYARGARGMRGGCAVVRGIGLALLWLVISGPVSEECARGAQGVREA